MRTKTVAAPDQKQQELRIPQQSDFPQVVEAKQKAAKLAGQRADIEQRIQKAEAARRASYGASVADDVAAKELLATGSIPPQHEVVSEDVGRLRRELAVVARAQQIAEGDITRILREHAEEASRLVWPSHSARAARAWSHYSAFVAEVRKMSEEIVSLSEQGLHNSVGCPNLVPSNYLWNSYTGGVSQWRSELRANKIPAADVD